MNESFSRLLKKFMIFYPNKILELPKSSGIAQILEDLVELPTKK